ncbi:MAG TPA: branched-chain amino acid ABC transporter permease [Acidimicrobiales bacterium]|nr:branched-chain amino acid ABC transporter permease [Acidimicrobiales bacterium]
MLVALAIFPLVFTNPTVTTIAVFTLLFMASATAWNGFAGYSGYIALGHAAFFGTGAYVLAIVAQRLDVPGGSLMFALVPLAGLGAAVVAVPFGLVALRTRRHTFVVITIAVFFIFQLLAFNLSITEGSSGIQVASPNWAASTYNNPYYYVALGIVVFATVISWGLRRSVLGLQLLAIRDDEDRARGLGVPVGRAKLIAFVISAVPVGMCGAVYAYFLGQIFPQFAFNPLFDLSVALMSLFGGIGTLAGPLLGALLLESLQQYFTIQFSNGDLYLVIYGALFLAVLLWLPRGILPTLGDLIRRLPKSGARGNFANAAVTTPSGNPEDGDPRAGPLAIAGRGVVGSRREH